MYLINMAADSISGHVAINTFDRPLIAPLPGNLASSSNICDSILAICRSDMIAKHRPSERNKHSIVTINQFLINFFDTHFEVLGGRGYNNAWFYNRLQVQKTSFQ